MVCFQHGINMSKKSESEYDSDSATISGSISSNSAKSRQSSTHSSYLSSTNYDSSSLRSSCIWLSARKDEQQDQDQNAEACAIKETSNKSSSDDDDILDKTLLDRITVDQAYINRRFYTAPLYGSKLLSSIPCALNKIDENDEESTSGHSVHTSELASKRSGQFAWYSDEEYVERKITPRQLEVPPKKICLREVSPIIVKPQEHIPNKRFNFQNKSFVMRHVQNAESCSNVSTQIYWDVAVGDSTDDSCTIEDISEEFATKQKTSGQKSKIKKEEKQQLSILPHYVAEKAHNIPLEPNIVILDDESCSSDTSRRSSKGDAPNDDEKGFMYCCQPRNCYSRPSRSIFSALEKYFKSTSCEVSPYSPSLYRLSTDIPTPHIRSDPATSSSNSSHSDVRGQSHSEGRRKDPEHNFSTTFDMKAFKEILGNFSEGITPTRTFPIDFEDVDLRDEANQDISFKDKGSELICAIHDDEGNVEFSNPGQINRKSPTSKLLFDSRRNQSTDVEFYYDYGSSCSSSVQSLRSREDDTPVTDARDIKVDSDYTSYCCFCFRLFRSK